MGEFIESYNSGKRYGTDMASNMAQIAKENAHLVEGIKALQRKDPVAKEGWLVWVDQQHVGKKDPAYYPAEKLQDFIDQYKQMSAQMQMFAAMTGMVQAQAADVQGDSVGAGDAQNNSSSGWSAAQNDSSSGWSGSGGTQNNGSNGWGETDAWTDPSWQSSNNP